ncbi:AAA family ATPase [Flavobacterium sp. ANB]|uniref:ATP-dependent nuclease n=1 Tax=unclassified Flavobacterium TaxID=196869 RepID=UPI0012B9491D|nr:MULTISPECIES: AAA family ATPase [unclassified Flavobacterium]MBF4518945.1 AAA family ATPase [Flavobacterium sp. ANB]MTD71555.1 AAA family ATPase [Flavobacterium sp. LC2016-13]
MYLQNIKLWNFRKFGSDSHFDLEKPNLNLDFTSGLNILIGENDSGKTAIIDGIKLVLKTHSYEWLKIEKDDFYRESKRVRIELLFKGLSDEEAKNFTEWLSWEGTGDDLVPTLKLLYDVTSNDGKIVPSDIKAGPDKEGYMLTAGAKEFLKVTYLKPLRDAKSDLIPKKNSRLSQIFQEHEAFKGKEDSHHLIGIFNHFNECVKEYFEGNNGEGKPLDSDLKGKELKDEIDKYLQSFYDENKQTHIKVSEGRLKNILEKLELLVKDEINVGLGTLNRLFMASELLHLNKKDWDGIRLGLIEELEAHLHPQAQMRVIESLQKQNNIQLILTTHSPNLASKVNLENLILCINDYAFPLGKKYTKLKAADYPFLERFLDVTKSNLFFAKGLIFVEGVSEELIIPSLTDKLFELKYLNNNLTSSGTSIIAIGNTAFIRYSNIFLRNQLPYLGIPVSIVTDLDLRPVEFSDKYRISADKKKEKNIITEFDVLAFKAAKTTIYNKQSTKIFTGDFWTLEYCVALHPFLSKILYKSIVQSIEEIRSDNYKGTNNSYKGIKPISQLNYERKWKAFIKDKTQEKIAFDIMYHFIIDNKKISKSMIAMYFSQFLKTDIKTLDEIIIKDNPIQYLLDAIEYATKN